MGVEINFLRESKETKYNAKGSKMDFDLLLYHFLLILFLGIKQ